MISVIYAVVASHPRLTSSCRGWGRIFRRIAPTTGVVILDRLTLWVVGVVLGVKNPGEGFHVACGGTGTPHREHQFLRIRFDRIVIVKCIRFADDLSNATTARHGGKAGRDRTLKQSNGKLTVDESLQVEVVGGRSGSTTPTPLPPARHEPVLFVGADLIMHAWSLHFQAYLFRRIDSISELESDEFARRTGQPLLL